MSDDWDFYFCRVDGDSASIFVDLGIAEQAPIEDQPWMAYVRVHMRMPRPDGLSSQEEFEALIAIEDRLKSALVDGNVIYVGRNTSGRCRDFYFYAPQTRDWDDRVAAAMQPFSDYNYDSGSRSDPQWQVYWEFLHPSEEAMEGIQNRRVCESLRKNGDALTAPREIDHWVWFSDAAAQAKFLDAALELGFSVREKMEDEDPDRRYGVQLYRVDIPSIDNIDSVTLPLHRAAKQAGGDYDGWETYVVS